MGVLVLPRFGCGKFTISVRLGAQVSRMQSQAVPSCPKLVPSCRDLTI